MPLLTLKASIKSHPALYRALLPIVRQVRSVRDLPARLRRQRLRAAAEQIRRYCAVLPQLVPQPLFVKVGANDGVTGDPCSDILLAMPQWRGILIEPVPYCFERLRANFGDTRRFILEQVAVGATSGRASFYFVSPAAAEHIPNLPAWFDQLGSFDKTHILKQLDGILEPYIVETAIDVSPLADILQRHRVSRIDLLHIDTEGYDYEILKTIDFSQNAPSAVLVEHWHLSDDDRKGMRRCLLQAGYTVLDCGGDFFAIDSGLMKRLPPAASAG